MLPHGAKKRISELTGITQQTIVKFFKTGSATPKNALKIIETAMPFYEKQQAIIEAKNKLLNLLKQ